MNFRYTWLLLLCVSASPSLAQSKCDGRERLTSSDLKKMASRAESNDQAQTEVGFAYQCAGDNAEAARWYARAAMRGNSVAQTNLGAMYLQGQGVAQDDSAAVRWFQLAAVAGFSPAQNNLALMYSTGRGVKQSYEATFRWLEKAVANHYYPAYPAHAAQYLMGRGVAQDEKRGFELMLDAAKHGVVDAQAEVAMLYAQGRGTKADQEKALRWSMKAAKGGSAGAANNVGYFLARQANYAAAVPWYQRAAAAGIPEAEYNLQALTRAGLGSEQNRQENQRASEAMKAYLPPVTDSIHD